MEKEIWKDVKGYEGFYKISYNGEIKSLDSFINNKHNSKSFKRGRILKQHKNKKGYMQVKLCCNTIQKSYRVHRLVADAWVDNLNNKPQVNHLNGIKDDNHFSNLEWCSNKENIIHAYENKLINIKEGCSHHNSKLKSNQIKDILKSNKTIKTLSKKHKVSYQTIWKIKKGKSYKK